MYRHGYKFAIFGIAGRVQMIKTPVRFGFLILSPYFCTNFEKYGI